VLSVIFMVTGLYGCAGSGGSISLGEESVVLVNTSLKADELVSGGNVERAIDLLGDAAEANPSRKEPWVKLAKIHFDARDYGNAIVAADEALQRDNTDQVAKGIRVVSGLRVATQSLADLRGDVNLKGSARADAISLASMLRETLGEEVLVPSASSANKSAGEAGSVKKKPRIRVVGEYPVRSQPVEPAVSGDPFSVLK
jgi:tetratricopeptide (TPR) repeat protein